MPVIDADAHVIETDRTWQFAESSLREYAPVAANGDGVPTPMGDYWLIDGAVRSRLGNIGKLFPKESREMLDVSARLRHMDELGTDIQVLFPSILTPYTERPEVEEAFCQTYNRWLADVWRQSPQRLRWAAILPLMNMQHALTELRFARDHGACAVFVRSIEGDRQLIDPYFFPLYEEASKLDVPICVHASVGSSALDRILSQGRDTGNFLRFKLTVVGACHQVITNRIPDQFPKLRFGFIETSSQWVPFVVNDLLRRFQRQGWEIASGSELLKRDRIYVTCQNDDDLPFVLKYAGEDNLIIGSDYGHADNATEMEALRHLQERTDVEPTVIKKILDDNPRALYGL
ncbi:MAG TPA: amidohydrolase family protein [Chloroflexota bacterium]|nr:amidohydrolase family protein [Chloroflexota bacterium]